jgi:hypothetical protein
MCVHSRGACGRGEVSGWKEVDLEAENSWSNRGDIPKLACDAGELEWSYVFKTGDILRLGP